MRKVLMLTLVLATGLAAACASSPQQEERTSTTVSGGFVADEADLEREISDEEVATFAEAYIEVMAVQQQYHPRMQRATPEERAELAAESDARVEEIIESYGMSARDFNAIAVRLPLDDELRRRVQVQIQAQEEERLRELREELEREQEAQDFDYEDYDD